MSKFRITLWLPFLLATYSLGTCCLLAQVDETGATHADTAVLSPPELKLTLDDDFSQDSRSEYQLSGDTQWGAGRLTLAEGAAIDCQLANSGQWLELELDLEFPKLTDKGDKTDFRIWLGLDEFFSDRDCYVRLYQSQSNEKTISRIQLFDTNGRYDDDPQTQLFKEAELNTPLESGKYNISCRNGLWKVTFNTKPVFIGYLDPKFNARPIRVVLASKSGQVAMRHLQIRHSSWTANELSQEQTREIQEAQNLLGKLRTQTQSGKFENLDETVSNVQSKLEFHLGGYHSIYLANLNLFAQLYQNAGNFAEAYQYQRKSMELGEQTFGSDHPRFATSLNNMALLLTTMGQFEEVEAIYLRALRLRKQVLGKHPHCASTLANLAQFYIQIGSYDKAEPLVDESIQLRADIVGKNHPQYAISLGTKATLLQIQGHYEKAEPLYVEAGAIFEKTLGNKNPHYLTLIHNLAKNYCDANSFEKAESLYLESERLRKEFYGEAHPSYAISVFSLGQLYNQLGANDRAERYLLKAKELLANSVGTDHVNYSTTLNDLASVYSATQRYEKAEELYLETITRVQQRFGKLHDSYATGLTNLAGLKAKMGKAEEATQLRKEALQITESIYPPSHPTLVSSRYLLASNAYRFNDLTTAKQNFEKALFEGLENLERLSVMDTAALQRRKQLMMESRLDKYLSAMSRLDQDWNQAAEIALNWKGLVQLRQSFYRSLQDNESTKDTFSRLRLASQKLNRHLESDFNAPQWKRQLEELTSEKEDIEKELAAASSQFKKANRWTTLEQIQNSLPEDAAFINLHVYNDIGYVDNQENSESRILAFLITRTDGLKVIPLGEADGIMQAIRDFRSLFSSELIDSNVIQQYELAAKNLRQRLWVPIEERVQSKSRILISPAGDLAAVPFGTLPGKVKGSYLISAHSFVTIAVPSLLPELNEQKQLVENPKTLLFGDIDYNVASTASSTNSSSSESDETPRDEWSALAETGREVDSIASLFRSHDDFSDENVVVIKQQQATKEKFAETAGDYNFLHLATHGFFAPERFDSFEAADLSQAKSYTVQSADVGRYYRLYQPGLLSGLVFAGANGSDELAASDGIMTADEISYLQLGQVELVTLSACETGLGESFGVEGLVGIQRSIQIGGARTAVASLWKVDDLATRKLMERFYSNLLNENMSKSDALTEAQRWMLTSQEMNTAINRGKGKRTTSLKNSGTLHPIYWGGWILSGDWK